MTGRADGQRPAEDGAFVLFVNGTLMRRLALHHNLAGADFQGEARTAPIYRLYSIGDVHPGMFLAEEEEEEEGVQVAGELYLVPPDVWRRVEAGEPPGLYLGDVRLEDGRVAKGVLFQRDLAKGRHLDISAYGGWRAYLADRGRRSTPA